MAKGFKQGAGGGNPLNFRIFGGTAAPASPKENDIWVNTDTEITSWDFSATRSKNLLPYPYHHTTFTSKGVTFTDNGDGTVTANSLGTGGATQVIFVVSGSAAGSGPMWLEPGTYTFSGYPDLSVTSTYIGLYDFEDKKYLVLERGSGTTFTLSEGKFVRCDIIVNANAVIENAVFKPQLEKGSTATPFVKGDAPSATGQVWISTGTASLADFNALKKNGIQVYPISAKQYINGEWVSKEAQSYQNGAWVFWGELPIYKEGNQYESVTGGWVNTGGFDATFNSTDISFVAREGTLLPVNAIDLTNYSNFHVEIDNFKSSANTTKSIYLRVYDETKTETIADIMYVPAVNETKTTLIMDLDISGITGEKYIGIYTYSNSSYAYMTGNIREMRLEA